MNNVLMVILSGALSAIFTLNLFLLTRVYSNQTTLAARIKEATDAQSDLRVLIAGDYVRRDELEKQHQEMLKRMIRFEEKLDAFVTRFPDRPT